jgi:hypothetical protein
MVEASRGGPRSPQALEMWPATHDMRDEARNREPYGLAADDKQPISDV